MKLSSVSMQLPEKSYGNINILQWLLQDHPASHIPVQEVLLLSNGKLVTFGASAILSCLDAKTGKLFWKRENPTNAVPQFFTGMSPLIADKMCIAHVGNKG